MSSTDGEGSDVLGHDLQACTASIHAQLPYEMNAARMARRLVGGLLGDCDLSDEIVHDTELVAHELVMNAFQHGAPDPGRTIELMCALRPGAVAVSVHDGGSAGEVAPQPFSAERPSGRGLVMVDGLCESWTVDRSLGTRVTAHLAAAG